ncbi:MAG TPA: hypothetical protein DCX39_00455 [Firmicutes bacterium]|nr:hypothetical protein [Bacillota bacterium]HAW99635.1 hypothetical protein [Bacillota bacterium]
MIKYFYLVKFEYFVNDEYKSYFNLGIFSNLKLAKKKVSISSGLVGFRKYGFDNFKIIKFGVDFDTDIKDKSNVVLYCVTHEYDNPSDEFTYWSIFDYFSTIEKAKKYIEYLKKHSRIGKKYPNNFEIIDVKIDNFNSWSEGFEELNNL